MKINSLLSDEQVLREIGGRMARLRLDMDLTQRDLAEQAGVSLRTVQRLETGVAATHLSGFLRLCRILGLAGRFEMLLPEPSPSPMALLKHQGKVRRRASGNKSWAVGEEAAPWKWGDEP